VDLGTGSTRGRRQGDKLVTFKIADRFESQGMTVASANKRATKVLHPRLMLKEWSREGK